MSERVPGKILYTAQVDAVGGRQGHVRSDDGYIDLDTQPPKEVGGPGGATNPEQLFAAGYSACFQSAMGVAARRQKVDVSQSRVRAEVGMGAIGSGAMGLAVTLTIAIPGTDPKTVRALVEAAHQVCPYSNATRGNIPVTLVVEGE